MNSSDTLWDLADDVHDLIVDLPLDGSVGTVIGGVLKIPVNVVYVISNIFGDFGS